MMKEEREEDQEAIRLAVPVEVLSRSDGNISSQVIYREPRHELTSFISEIRVEEKVFRFPEIKPVRGKS